MLSEQARKFDEQKLRFVSMRIPSETGQSGVPRVCGSHSKLRSGQPLRDLSSPSAPDAVSPDLFSDFSAGSPEFANLPVPPTPATKKVTILFGRGMTLHQTISDGRAN